MQNRLLLMLVAILGSIGAPASTLDSLEGQIIHCREVSQARVGTPFELRLKLVGLGAYHRDGYWYEAEYNGPVVHSYIFVSSLHVLTSGSARGYMFEGIINRGAVKRVELTDVQHSSNPKFPTIFSGKVFGYPDRQLSCFYDTP